MNEHQNNPPRSATNDNRTRLRLFVEYDLEDGHAVPANPDQHNYLRKVMRRKDGDMVALFNGRHGEWLARIAYESKSRCVLIVEQHLREQRVPPDVWSLFAPVKASPMNNIARMSTELGVGRICPVLTEHTDVTRVNTARLRANAVEAAEQSTRLNVPMVDEPEIWRDCCTNGTRQDVSSCAPKRAVRNRCRRHCRVCSPAGHGRS